MVENPKYLIVDTGVLPDVFLRVVQAKKLLAQGQAKNASEASRMAGISRSAFYKYKDCVHQYHSRMSDNIVTINATLADEPGVLSNLMALLYSQGGNILTINQNIPVDSVAPVSISLRTDGLSCTEDELLEQAASLAGVVDVKIISGQ
ncbi:MAG: ACT domain-containing protein [Oscillospiraceae bacterium]|nr:ACT domain-containing protein [Oscillospiraceae bacterium]